MTPRPSERPRPPRPPRHACSDLLTRLDRALAYLAAHRIVPVSFNASTLGELPIICVEPSNHLYEAFAGWHERKGYRQEGARRYEVHQAIDVVCQVRICWLEVVCAS
jgi:hypothetical protein